MKESHTKQKGDSNHASRFGHEDVLICGSDMIQSKGASQVLQELLNKHSFDSYLVHAPMSSRFIPSRAAETCYPCSLGRGLKTKS